MALAGKRRLLKLIAAVYMIFSLPAVFYAGYKTIKGITLNYYDFHLENEITGEGIDTLLVAHAGGALYGTGGEIIPYTNSLEAIEQNYQRGHRVFEIDFLLTKDGKLAAVHDWKLGKEMTQAVWIGAPINEKWKSEKIYGKYTTLDIDDIITLMEKYRDIFIVTDTKETQKNIVTNQFMAIYKAAGQTNIEILDRFIPQIYYPQMLKIIYDIYPFKNVIYTLYQSLQSDEEVVEFVKNHNSIYAVTMWPYRATENFVNELTKLDKRVYVHTVNAFEEAYQIMKSGVSGLYTDYLY
ncbi:MAG: hypothetical protein LBK66_02685 [Spirochaetaceae bacterium]|jgi:glycerophosphoryl diester phosphodiesterase|nr:hypothetical protein [Spirochaetaceae bacterium]